MRHGRSLAEVAASEGLSESEVRLHLGLGDAALPDVKSAPATVPAVPDESVLDDLERWMSTLGSGRAVSGGAPHAVVRG